MARQNTEMVAFNRGLVSPLGLARVDIERVKMMAEESTNWLPRALGPMSPRPGLGFIGNTKSNGYARYIPFVFATDDTALLELTSGLMRVWVNDALVARPSVATATTNGTFATDVASWTNLDEAGATSAWATGGYLSLTGNGFSAAIREQAITPAAGDLGVEHAVRLVSVQGECHLRVGSTSGGDDYVTETFLYPGTHSLSFTPTGTFYIQVLSRERYPTLIDSVTIDTAGALEIATPWTTATQLDDIRFDQSGDVIFAACAGVRQMRIERRSVTSWSVADFVTDDGPFLPANVTNVTMTPSALSGSITLTSSRPYFLSTNVGSLMKMTSVGHNVSFSTGTANQWTDEIKVIGSGTSRDVPLVITITGTATVILQRAVGDTGDWFDVATYTATTSATYNDGLTNQVAYYRLVARSISSGTVTLAMNYQYGSKVGFVRITGYTSPTQVTGNVLTALGSLIPTDLWSEGQWSDRRGHPSAVALYQGRLFWAGNDKVNGSVSDSYISYDEDYPGDAGPISRSIGTGPVETIRWLHAGTRLLLGGQGSEWEARSSSLDEPLTPTNFNIKLVSTRGSAAVDAEMVDHDIVFVDRSKVRVLGEVPDSGGGYTPVDMNNIVPEVTSTGVANMAVQRQPDTRLHLVLLDGTVAVLVYDKVENVKCWTKLSTTGSVERVVVLPGDEEDRVYYAVNRTINGATVRTLERFAKWSECVGGTVNKMADGFVTYSGVATTSITGLDHLEGETVVCWADGTYQGSFVVTAGEVTLTTAVSEAVVGLTYRARWRSTKLAMAAQGGAALSQPRRVDHVALILANTHAKGIKYGVDFDYMDDLPLMESGVAVDPDAIWTDYSQHSVEANGEYTTDARLCLEANAPYPATVLAAVISLTANDKL